MSAGVRQQQEALWALDAYEEQRTARPVVVHGSCTLPYAEVSKLMKCPVCLNLLDETSTMNEVRALACIPLCGGASVGGTEAHGALPSASFHRPRPPSDVLLSPSNLLASASLVLSAF